jgi:hypothetical protein
VIHPNIEKKADYEAARRISKSIFAIREDYKKRFTSKDRIERKLGLIAYLIENLQLKIEGTSSPKYLFGVLDLKMSDLQFLANYTIRFRCSQFRHKTKVDKLVYYHLLRLTEHNEPDQNLFGEITAQQVNLYLVFLNEDLSPK